ncbi:Oidioi.mRNA.OKI2018_I69.PAR.g8673.t1.cds [Oikopleura dioica]|uniref:Oidioi.mRNA.OKI2018_I69.PAR.g8673.t1.cds n=1 Tax=Oikopleura dioica TaxID=34765 RepID=A0ABN7RH34_OIKDI|nr:Oidioi.mRNA.OKI2018_I69.PAR.g8673.t1.cds [Oikopleura dioica]
MKLFAFSLAVIGANASFNPFGQAHSHQVRSVSDSEPDFDDFMLSMNAMINDLSKGGRVPSWLEDNGTGVYKRSSGRPAGTGFDEDAIKAAFFRNL